MKKRLAVSFVMMTMALFSLIVTSDLMAYEEIDVLDGGSISGTITIEGQIPKPRVFALIQFPFGPFCKKISDGEVSLIKKIKACGKLSLPSGIFRKENPIVPPSQTLWRWIVCFIRRMLQTQSSLCLETMESYGISIPTWPLSTIISG